MTLDFASFFVGQVAGMIELLALFSVIAFITAQKKDGP